LDPDWGGGEMGETLFGKQILRRLSQRIFTKTVGVILIGIGMSVLIQA